MAVKVSTFKKQQKKYLEIAKDLKYTQDIFDKIMCAKTYNEINKALRHGRQMSYKLKEA